MPFTIRPALKADLPVLFTYLNDHLLDNGQDGTALFMPIPRSQAGFPPEKQASIRNGMLVAVGQPGWRRPWVAYASDGSIAGHIDLRARPEKVAAHRCLLGMGVQRSHRRQGLGEQLIDVAVRWAQEQGFAWVDLDVMSINEAAIGLYKKCGFHQIGEIDDMFRIDGDSLAYTIMTRRIG
ncbi:GNAT family N-acetyltransferase [Massilia sp. PAMC28688]|uniref:GNAT family N-acetyltransferase n=1 Tax=Massilia sp. PAMC28688 TaxID=2861283 RepID=UPI001C62973E|nr:GNAT family N-acetyltransferase [Massilia sp. PAMC28688]QYF95304.1 GNAT family N-acetyltransferase [Massilia sp. PAMC28688]